MEILPVLDLLNGVVVRGVAGRRAEYQPVRSVLSDSFQPLQIARALRSSFGLTRLYVADLDGILRGKTNWETLRQLIDDGFQLLVDAGIRNAASARQIRDLGAHPIVGLETTATPGALAEIAEGVGNEVTFSLDLLDGRPQFVSAGNDDQDGWSTDPVQIARQAVRAHVTSIIVLDLADVGMSSGGRTDGLCRTLISEFPNLNVICGGGVRGLDDLLRMRALGAKGVLVASALHDGRLNPSHLDSIRAALSS